MNNFKISRMPHSLYIREPNEFEKRVLQYIQEHPGLTAEDVILEFSQYEDTPRRTEASKAVAFLTENLFVERRMSTIALYAMEVMP